MKLKDCKTRYDIKNSIWTNVVLIVHNKIKAKTKSTFTTTMNHAVNVNIIHNVEFKVSDDYLGLIHQIIEAK